MTTSRGVVKTSRGVVMKSRGVVTSDLYQLISRNRERKNAPVKLTIHLH